MIDNLSILLSHGLILIAFYYLINRDDLDTEEPPIPDEDPEGFGKSPEASYKKNAPQNRMVDKKDNLKNENARA